MDIANYAGFLDAARTQPDPQRLLFVFTRAELPAKPSAALVQRFKRGEGGELTPLMCLDRLPSELDTFEQLLDESRRIGQEWDIMFAASFGGKQGAAPESDEADAPLKLMIDSIHRGAFERFLAFDRSGNAVAFS